MRARAVALAVLGALVLGLALSSWLARQRPGRETPRAGSAGVVLFAPNLSETAWALGHGDRILGVTDYCIWPAELLERPRVGGMVDPDLERLLALDPGLLVVQGESRVLGEFAAEHGIRLARVDMDRDLESILSGFVQLDSILGDGVEPGGRELRRRVEGELQALAASRPAGELPRTLISLGHDPDSLTRLWCVGEGSFLLELLEIAGGRAPFEDTPPGYFELGLERLITDPPDLVLELRPGEHLEFSGRRAMTQLWRDQGIRAPVAFVEFDGSLIPGPRIAQTARAFRAALDGARNQGEP